MSKKRMFAFTHSKNAYAAMVTKTFPQVGDKINILIYFHLSSTICSSIDSKLEV